ncbi:hypothetical protein NP233_g11454 [Leucocoprinus birnbaumii]|uniref:Thiol methyltransferase 1 n=1 Tax=Leucocoprinus birnbaumii TaxID=56174 RepID=A0AAD5YL98_9AGAR|nr:hypothetical protein NP233_g11454 [Leucocoprinus birnbaumii]
MPDQVGGGAVPAAQSEIVQAMRKLVNPNDPASWDITCRKAGVTPWDAGEIQPPLREAIENNTDGIAWPTDGSALVPGCGSGYDVVYLASTLGLKVIGLDTSQTAVDKATAFFVAIPPSRRNEWGQKMAELIAPGGYLITLVFPIDPETDLGPPFYVRPDHYNEPLSAAFEKVVDRDPTTSSASHVGRERLMIWKRKAD